jgi:hypothetical protein
MEGARYFEDGRLVIFKRSGIFYARLRTSGSAKYLWRSLRTTDERAAIQLGRRLLFQIEQRNEQGFPLKSKLFSTVIDDYIAYRERDHAHGRTTEGMLRQIIRVAKFWRAYAGELTVEAPLTDPSHGARKPSLWLGRIGMNKFLLLPLRQYQHRR